MEGAPAAMLIMLHVGHATSTFEGVLTFAGLGLSGVGVGADVLALQKAITRRGLHAAEWTDPDEPE